MKRLVFLVMAVAVLPGVARAGRATADSTATEPTFVALHSGKAMEVPGTSHDPGAQIIQWEPHGGVNQQWQLVPFGAGTGIFVIVSHDTGLALDVAGASTADGAQVIQWPWHGGINQLWVALPFSQLLPDGDPDTYVIVSAASGKALDVAGASSADGAGLIQWPWHGGLNQIWLSVDPAAVEDVADPVAVAVAAGDTID